MWPKGETSLCIKDKSRTSPSANMIVLRDGTTEMDPSSWPNISVLWSLNSIGTPLFSVQPSLSQIGRTWSGGRRWENDDLHSFTFFSGSTFTHHCALSPPLPLSLPSHPHKHNQPTTHLHAVKEGRTWSEDTHSHTLVFLKSWTNCNQNSLLTGNVALSSLCHSTRVEFSKNAALQGGRCHDSYLSNIPVFVLLTAATFPAFTHLLHFQLQSMGAQSPAPEPIEGNVSARCFNSTSYLW